MKQFFKYVFASMIGTFLSVAIVVIIAFFIVFGIIAGSLSNLSSPDKTEIEGDQVLELKLDRPIVDRGGSRRFNFNGPGDFSMFKEKGLNNIIEALEKAQHDERIQGVRLKLDQVIAGMGTMKELRDALVEFRDSSDKFLVTYGKGFSQKGYYLASAADRIEIYPEGSMLFKGLATELTFFKRLFDRFDVDMQVVRGSNNKYKSAVEPFTREEMSEPSRKQMKEYLGDLWNVYLKDVSQDRGISREELDRMADSLKVRSASDAVRYGLIDGTSYPDEFEDGLRDSLGLDADEEIPTVSLTDYLDVSVPDKHWTGKDREPAKENGKKGKENGKLAVVYASGGIQSGESSQGVLGSKTTSDAIQKAREDSNVKAVVLRVNSPGGSALASDRIWREIELTKEEKPFIVSMGNVAASGGYYISCGADRIFADPNTITGSIGVFGMIPHIGDLYEKHLGITFDRVKTNEYADLMTPTRKLRKKERALIEEQIDSVYQQFLRRVADGRDMEKAEVDSIARGRVWSGKDAERIGLVDELGGMEDAVAHAEEQVEADDLEQVAYPERKDPFQRFMDDLNMNVKEKVLNSTLGSDMRFYRKYRYVRSVLDMEGVQMRMPYHIEVR